MMATEEEKRATYAWNIEFSYERPICAVCPDSGACWWPLRVSIKTCPPPCTLHLRSLHSTLNATPFHSLNSRTPSPPALTNFQLLLTYHILNATVPTAANNNIPAFTQCPVGYPLSLSSAL